MKNADKIFASLAPLAYFIFISCGNEEIQNRSIQIAGMDEELVSTNGKKEMLLVTDRPPNLETPLKYFLEDYTPNNVFFVRWHLAGMPQKVDEDTFRLKVKGQVVRELSLSLKDLKNNFKPFSITALALCAGNSRSFFDPRVPGAQWKNGAMGNARWKGVKLKDILEAAGINSEAREVTFNGLDSPPMDGVPDYVKSLNIAHCLDGEVMLAYEMNGEPIPLLNGFPLKLVVPGWYATYWVGMVHEINVEADSFKGFWMEKAYLIPKDSPNGNEKHDSLGKNLEQISRICVRSIFVSPEPNTLLKEGRAYEIQGLAFDGGNTITKVEISSDSGKTWIITKLDENLGKYSWRRWRYSWKPPSKGIYRLMVKAENSLGEKQPAHHWNRSGYMRNEVEALPVIVE